MQEYPVCLNPSCKSYGHSHPNCKCHPNQPMAEGGMVEGFCTSHKLHNEKCKYFADGGVVNPPDADPNMAASAYLSHGGLQGLLKLDSEDPSETVQKYNQFIKRGHKNLNTKIDHLFTGGKSDKVDFTKPKKLIDEWIEKGGIAHDIQQEMGSQNNPQMFASGGEVLKSEGIHNRHIADAYPAQNMLLQTAKGRISNYLSSLKPQKNQPKLAFDDEPDQTKQKRSYEKALKMAVDPLRILHKVKEGTIEPEHVQHFKAMYPEVGDVIQKKLNEKIIQAQLDGKKPSYKVRQGLSMLLGAPLSGEMTQQNMMAAQAVFQSQKPQQPQQGGGTSKKNTSSLSKADDDVMTGNQARIARSQKQ